MPSTSARPKKPAVLRSSTSENRLPEVAIGAADSARIHADNRVFGATQGHGYAAEAGNHVLDLLSGKDAVLAPEGLAKNGADRLVDGVYIQTKYCESAASSIRSCFNENGQFRYLRDGGPIQIEVPPEQAPEAIELLAKEISAGNVPGESNPNCAGMLVRSGRIKRVTAIKITEPGNLESLSFDLGNGISVASKAGGLSAAVTFAQAIWNGASIGEAAEAACYAALKVGGIAWATSVLTAQLGRTVVNAGAQASAEWAVQQLRQHGGSLFRGESSKQLSKVLHSEGMATLAATVILSTADVARAFDGRISMAQLFKNVTTTAIGTYAGQKGMGYGVLQGAQLGTRAGSFFGPPGAVIGAAAGALVGALVGSSAATTAAQAATRFVLDGLIEDDAEAMRRLLNDVFVEQAEEAFLGRLEIDAALDELTKVIDGSALRDIFAANDRHEHARSLVMPAIDKIVDRRITVPVPADGVLDEALQRILARATAALDTEPAWVTSRDGALRCALPVGWEIDTRLDDWKVLPYLIHEQSGVSMHFVRSTADTSVLAKEYAEISRGVSLKSESTVAVGEIERAWGGEREAYRYDRIGNNGIAQIVTLMRMHDCFYRFTLIALTMDAAKSQLDAVGQMLASICVVRTPAESGSTWRTFVSADGGFSLRCPPFWKQLPAEPGATVDETELFWLESKLGVVLRVQHFPAGDGDVMAMQAEATQENLVNRDPESVINSRETTINGRQAAIIEALWTYKSGRLWTGQTLVALPDGSVLSAVGVIDESSPAGYREQCLDMICRIQTPYDA